MNDTNQPTFEEKLDMVLNELLLAQGQARNTYGNHAFNIQEAAQKDAKESIKALILSDVVGEGEVEDVDLSKKSNTRKAIRSWNRHRAEQRSIINGSKT